MGINEVIREMLKVHLKNENLTQESFANEIGVVKSTISRFVKGTYNANGKLLQKIAKGMGGDLEYVKK